MNYKLKYYHNNRKFLEVDLDTTHRKINVIEANNELVNVYLYKVSLSNYDIFEKYITKLAQAIFIHDALKKIDENGAYDIMYGYNIEVDKVD